MKTIIVLFAISLCACAQDVIVTPEPAVSTAEIQVAADKAIAEPCELPKAATRPARKKAQVSVVGPVKAASLFPGFVPEWLWWGMVALVVLISYLVVYLLGRAHAQYYPHATYPIMMPPQQAPLIQPAMIHATPHLDRR